MTREGRSDRGRQPLTHDEWVVHALNIHGTFFEKWCARQVEEAQEWTLVDTEYPVEYVHQSRIDVWASCQVEDSILNLTIECKKNDPTLSSWVFFHDARDPSPEVSVSTLGWRVSGDKGEEFLGTNSEQVDGLVATGGRQVRESYDTKKIERQLTKTTTKDIDDAAQQAFVGARALFWEQAHLWKQMREAHESNHPPWRLQYFLPVIVTTAELCRCDFEHGDVDPSTGEIELGSAQVSSVDYLYYEYPIPKRLQLHASDPIQVFSPAMHRSLIRGHILVVRSTWFNECLRRLRTSLARQGDLLFPSVARPES